MELGVSDGNFDYNISLDFGIVCCHSMAQMVLHLEIELLGWLSRWNADEQVTLIRCRPYAVLLRPLSGKLLPAKVFWCNL